MIANGGNLLLLVDYENIRRNVHVVEEGQLGTWLLSYLKDHGNVAFPFLFVDAGDPKIADPDVMRILFATGFTIVHCPKTPIHGRTMMKDTVDQAIVQMIHQVLDHSPDITTIVLASGDRDFSQALAAWKRRGKKIIVLGHQSVSSELRELADQVIDVRPTPQRAIEVFRSLLHERFPEVFTRIKDPSVVLVRDVCADYLRNVISKYIAQGQRRVITSVFIKRGLRCDARLNRWSETELGMLRDCLLETVFRSHFDGLDSRYYDLEPNHPFVEYALAQPVLPHAQTASQA